MNEIAKLSSRVWHPKAVQNEIVQPTMIVPNLQELRPETPAEAEVFARRAQTFSEAKSAGRRVSPFASTAPKPPIVGEQLSNDSMRSQVASLSDAIAQIRPGQLQPLNIESIGSLSGLNQLAHDRITAVPQDKMGHILSSGIPQKKTLFLQRPLSSTSPANEVAPKNKLQLEEIFHAVQSPDGTATTLGRTLINNEWYHFGTNSGTSPLQQASTWIAPTRLLTSQNPALEKDLSADRVLRDVQGLFKGPWNPYLKGAGLLNKPHTVDIRHADKDGIKSILATLNTITGTLETIQSVTKGIQQGLEFIGMLGSLGDLGKYMQIFNQMKLPGTPGELITALITGKGINPNKPPVPLTADQTGSGKNGVLVTKGGAAAKAMGDGLLAKAEAEKKKAEEEAAKKEAIKRLKSPRDEKKESPERIDKPVGSSSTVTPQRIQAIENKVNARFGPYMRDLQKNDDAAGKVSTIYRDQSKLDIACNGAVACHQPKDGKPGALHFPEQASDHVLAHELVHRNSSQEFKQALGNDVNEGMTDYFASQISNQNLPENHSYNYEKRLMSDIRESVGEDVLRRAFFGGDPEAIAKVKEARDHRF